MKVVFGLGKYIYEQLQCRLERMERRMSILKQREEGQDCKDIAPEPAQSKFHGATSHTAPTRGNIDSTRTDLKRKRKRSRFALSSRKQSKYRKALQSNAAGLRWKDQEPEEDSSEESNDATSENEGSQNRTDDDEEEEEEESQSADDREEEEEDRFEDIVINYPMMETEALYHLYYPKHVFSCLERVSQEKNTQNDVETPSWRLKPLTNMYQLEGTENITDEAYNKRHQKFEMEEKRRKRWDMQRLRELRIFEKQQKQKEDEMRASQDEADVETFLPSVQDLTHIEITESIPVMAFGQPVPFISPSEFEIPWDMSSSSQSLPSSRHKNNTLSRRH